MLLPIIKPTSTTPTPPEPMNIDLESMQGSNSCSNIKLLESEEKTVELQAEGQENNEMFDSNQIYNFSSNDNVPEEIPEFFHENSTEEIINNQDRIGIEK